MRKLRKLTALFLALLMTASLFAGCGNKAAEGDKKHEDTTKKEETVKNEEKVKLKFACWDYSKDTYQQNLIAAFKAANPNIDVDVIDISAAEYSDKMTVNLAGNADIDVFYSKDLWFYGGAVLKNQILPLDDLIAKENVDIRGYGDLANAMKIDGKLFGLPYRSDFWLVYYNKSLFDKMKVAYPKNGWTWEDFRDTAKKLTSGEGAKKTYGAYIQTWPGQYTLPGLQKDYTKSQLNIDYKQFKDGFKLLYDMQNVDKSAADYATNVSIGAHYRGAFEKGNVGMIFMGTWVMQMLADDKKAKKFDFDWEMVPIPIWKGIEPATMQICTPVSINSKTKNKDAAWKLAKFLSGKDGAKILANNLIMPGYIDSEITKMFTENSALPKGAAEALKVNKTYLELPAHKLTGFVGKMITEEIQLVMTGNKSIDQGIADMEKRRKEIIEQNK